MSFSVNYYDQVFVHKRNFKVMAYSVLLAYYTFSDRYSEGHFLDDLLNQEKNWMFTLDHKCMHCFEWVGFYQLSTIP